MPGVNKADEAYIPKPGQWLARAGDVSVAASIGMRCFVGW